MIMNPVELCRLCLSASQLVDLFDPKIINAAHLRKCVLIFTGIHIRFDDTVSRFICRQCSYLLSLQYEFRCRALENNRSIQIYQSTQIALKQEELRRKEAARRNRNLPKILPKWTSVHWSVKSLFKRYNKLRIPVEVIMFDVSPTLALTKVDSASFVGNKEPDKTKRMPPRCQQNSTSKFFKCKHCNSCFPIKLKLKKHMKLHKQCVLCLKWLWATNFKRHYEKCVKTIRAPVLSLVKVDDEYPMLKPFIKLDMYDKITLKRLKIPAVAPFSPKINSALSSIDEVDVIEVVANDEGDELLNSLVAENGICLSMRSVPNSSEGQYSTVNAEFRKRVLETRAEISHISSIFQKYANVPNSVVTPYNLDSIVSYATDDGGGIVKNIASDLAHFYIPVQFRVNEESDVRVCLNASLNLNNDATDFFDWSVYEVQSLKHNEQLKESSSDSNLDSGIFKELIDDLSQYPNIRVKAPWECNSFY